MIELTTEEQRLLAMAEAYLPEGTVGNMKLPFLVDRGDGAFLYDVSGNEYLDWQMTAGVAVLGHAHPAVVEAIIQATRDGTAFFHTHKNAVLLAEELVKAVPCAEKVRFTTSGSEACFQAIKAARAFRKKDKIVKFVGAYHGTTDVGLTSYNLSESDVPNPVVTSGGIPKVMQDLVITSHFNDLEGTKAIIEEHHDELAAVIVEPVQRVTAPIPGFLAGLREVTSRYGVLLIFDEVVTGFRLAYGGAQEFYGVTPDLCAMGKIIGGGLPLAAVMGRDDILGVFDSRRVPPEQFVFQVGTQNGNPVACAAGLAALGALRQGEAYVTLTSAGRNIREAIVEICAENGIDVQVCGEDALFDIYFTNRPIQNHEDTLTADEPMMMRYNQGLLDNNIVKNGLKVHPSGAHTDEVVERTIDVLRKVIPNLRS